jgi:chaperonin GroES
MSNPSGLTPCEYNIIVQLDPVVEKTVGGIIIPESIKDRDKIANQEGTLVAVSPMAFTFEDWPAQARKPQVGDRVLFSRYAGAIHERNGHEFRILKDSSIIAIVEPVAAIVERDAA